MQKAYTKKPCRAETMKHPADNCTLFTHDIGDPVTCEKKITSQSQSLHTFVHFLFRLGPVECLSVNIINPKQICWQLFLSWHLLGSCVLWVDLIFFQAYMGHHKE